MTIDFSITALPTPITFKHTVSGSKVSINTRSTSLEPIFIQEVALPSGKLLSKLPLVFHPTFDEKNDAFFIIDPTLGIDVFAQTRDELLKELEEVIPVLWSEYATADSDVLSISARQLKKSLREAFKELNHAA